MAGYRPAERVRQLAEAAHDRQAGVSLDQLAREVQDDADPAAVLAALATVAAGAIDIAGAATHQPFTLMLQRLLGLIPGPRPDTDPDLACSTLIADVRPAGQCSARCMAARRVLRTRDGPAVRGAPSPRAAPGHCPAAPGGSQAHY